MFWNCPPLSPDLNPIESMWCRLDEKIPLECRHKKEEFLNDLQAVFDTTDVSYLQHLVKSISHLLEAVIVAKGHNTKY